MKTENGVAKTLEKIVESVDTTSDLALYDREAIQKIPLTISKGGSKYEVAIELEPLTDEEYFALQDAVQASAKRLKSVSVNLFQPFADLARTKAVARHGYKENPNWKTATKDNDFISALNSYLHVSAKDAETETSDLLDDESDTPIKLVSNFNGREIETTIYFREESKAQMDEYLAILGNQAGGDSLASHKKISKERRLFALACALKVSDECYAGEVPAWHLIEAVSSALNASLARMGKS